MARERMCRTCQAVHGLLNVFEEENKQLIVMLYRIAYIMIEEHDLLPKHLCYSCANRIQLAFEFIVQSQKIDTILRAQFEESSPVEGTLLKLPNDEDFVEPKSVEDIPDEHPDGIQLKSPHHSDNDRILIKIDSIAEIQEGISQPTDDTQLEPTSIESDNDNDETASLKDEFVNDSLDQSSLNQDTVTTVEEDCTEDEAELDKRYSVDADLQFSLDDIIEVDEDYIETTDFENYIEEYTVESVTVANIDEETDEKSSTKPQRMPKVKNTYKQDIKEPKTYSCPFCSATFTNYAEFNGHKKSHGAYRYVCKICDKRFTTNEKLKVHTETHNGTKVACHLCDKQCSNRGNLRRHIRQCHDKVRPYSCEICSVQFSRKSSLKLHALSHTEERNYNCSMCDKSYKTPAGLYIHKQTHQPDFVRPVGLYVCEFCGKKFNSQGNHLQHTKRHSAVKEFECEVCHKRFHFRTALRTHMHSHTGERPYSCDLCGKCFRQIGHLRTHKRNIHEPSESTKRFSCQFCEKRYTSVDSLKIHERIHTGEKPYKCDECEMCFADLSGLKRHRRKVHSNGVADGGDQTIVLDEHNSITIHESEMGELSTYQEHIVSDHDDVFVE